MAEDRLTCSQKQPHPVLRTLRAPGKYLGLGWQKDLLGLGAETEFSKMITWLVETALCPLTPLCGCEMSAQIDLIYIERLVSLRVPPSRTLCKEIKRDLYVQGLRRESSGGKLNYDLRIIPLAPLGRCHHVCQSLLGKKNKNIPLPVTHRGEQAKGRERRTN